jgi:hypothetical protein
MPRDNRIESTRRGLLRAGAAGIVGAVGIGTAAGRRSTVAVDPADCEARPMPTMDVTPADTRTVQPVPEQAAGIRPGSVLVTDNGGGTAGFIWREVDEEKPDEELDLYVSTSGGLLLGEANASANATRGEEEGEDLSELTVEIDLDGTFGGVGSQAGTLTTTELGEVVYARQATPLNESGFGDIFGLVRVPDDMRDMVDPSIPQFGGPTGVSPGAIPTGEPIHLYGNSVHGATFVSKGRTGSGFGELGTDSWASVIPRYGNDIDAPGDNGAPVVASNTSGGLPAGGVAGGIATHLTVLANSQGLVVLGAAGTIMEKCKRLVKDDLGLEIELVQAGEL